MSAFEFSSRVASGGPPTFVGAAAVTNVDDARNVADHMQFPAISGSQSGDLAIYFFCADTGEAVFENILSGQGITSISENYTTLEAAVGYKALTGALGAETFAQETAETIGRGWCAIVAVFRNVSYSAASGLSTGSSGNPNPPSRACASGDMIVAVGGLDDDKVDITAQTGYTLAAADKGQRGSFQSSAAISYKIATSTSENPGAFSSSGSDFWQAATIRLVPA